MNNIDFSILLSDYKAILNGIYTTILVSILASIIAFVLGTIMVYFRTSCSKFIRKITNFTISCIRNTPLLIVIYLFYSGLPSLKIVLPAFTCGVLALGIYSAAYISDALLSGINAVPQEHAQTAKALGLTRLQAFIHIIYPQALRHSLYILGNQFMNLIKNSSLVSFITVMDIFYVVDKGIADSYSLYSYFILAIVVYCSLTGSVLLITNILQKLFKIPSNEVLV